MSLQYTTVNNSKQVTIGNQSQSLVNNGLRRFTPIQTTCIPQIPPNSQRISTPHHCRDAQSVIRACCVNYKMRIMKEKLNNNQTKSALPMESFKRVFTKFGVYMILLGIAVLIALLPNIVSSKRHLATRRPRYAMDLKYILIWKKGKKNSHHKNVFKLDEIYPEGQKSFIVQNCPYINCYISYNKSLLRIEQNFDAIVFNLPDLAKLNTYNINLGRYSHQRFIFKSFQSSQKHAICNPWLDDFFNWTWTYRLDSDIPYPLIRIYDKNNTIIGPSKNVKWVDQFKNTQKRISKIKRKTKAVAWFASSCNLQKKHSDFVQDLKIEMAAYNQTVDTYGPCSDHKKCGQEKNKEACMKKIEKDYHFQLVLEDSVTQDYVTERLVRVMSRDIVPIVLGKNFSSFIPPGSYINAGAFDIKKLGAILNYLARNSKEYAFFLDWKDYYRYETRSKHDVCDLCTKMNKDHAEKRYKKFRQWWNKDYEEMCESQYLHLKFSKD